MEPQQLEIILCGALMKLVERCAAKKNCTMETVIETAIENLWKELNDGKDKENI